VDTTTIPLITINRWYKNHAQMVVLLLCFPHYSVIYIDTSPVMIAFPCLKTTTSSPHPHPGVLVAGAVADGRHAFQGRLLHLLFDVAGQVRHGTHQVH